MPANKKDAPVSKPTYAVMVTESIRAINDRTGSSLQAISKQLQSQYNIDINKPALLKAIKKGVEAGDFVQIKASYKLNPKSTNVKKKTVAPKKKVPVKTTTKKTQSTSTTKKSTAGPKKTITKKTRAKTSTTSTKKVAARKDVPKRSATTKRKASTKK